MFAASSKLNGDIHPNNRFAWRPVISTKKRQVMKTRARIVCAALPVFVIGLTSPAWAVDMDAMRRKLKSLRSSRKRQERGR
jgi:hypothetical protein